MAVITRIYENFTEADRARTALEALRNAQVEVSMLGDERLRSRYADQGVVRGDEATGAATGATLGAVTGGGAGLLAGLGMIAIPGIGPLVAAGWLAATAVGAMGGAVLGGTIGALTDLGISDEDAPVFDEAMRRGNVALTIRFPEELRSTVTATLDQVASVGFGDLRQRFEREGWRYEDALTERQARLRDTPPM